MNKIPLLNPNSTHQALVEHEDGESSEAAVAPVPVNQQHSLKKAEPGDRKVRRHHRLHALLA